MLIMGSEVFMPVLFLSIIVLFIYIDKLGILLLSMVVTLLIVFCG